MLVPIRKILAKLLSLSIVVLGCLYTCNSISHRTAKLSWSHTYISMEPDVPSLISPVPVWGKI